MCTHRAVTVLASAASAEAHRNLYHTVHHLGPLGAGSWAWAHDGYH